MIFRLNETSFLVRILKFGVGYEGVLGGDSTQSGAFYVVGVIVGFKWIMGSPTEYIQNNPIQKAAGSWTCRPLVGTWVAAMVSCACSQAQ